MTQPPYGEGPPPPYGEGPPPPYGEGQRGYGERPPPPYGEAPRPAPYPRQELLPQQVHPGRSRLPLLIAAIAVVAALVLALVGWRVFHGDGEDTRAAYCAALRKATGAGGLGGLASTATTGRVVPKAITDLADLAPQSVRNQWDDLIQLVRSLPGGSPDVGQAARAFTDVQAIIADAKSACGLDLQIPG
jgi:hypothetical protein